MKILEKIEKYLSEAKGDEFHKGDIVKWYNSAGGFDEGEIIGHSWCGWMIKITKGAGKEKCKEAEDIWMVKKGPGHK